MAKEEMLEMNGTVEEILPNAMFRVELENGHEIRARLAGKLRQHHIRVMLYDTVQVEISPYDVTMGSIVYRGQKKKPVESEADASEGSQSDESSDIEKE